MISESPAQDYDISGIVAKGVRPGFVENGLSRRCLHKLGKLPNHPAVLTNR